MMKQMNGNISDLDEHGLLPYHVIVAATRGDPDAMKRVMQHYEGYSRICLFASSATNAAIHITALTRTYAIDYVQG